MGYQSYKKRKRKEHFRYIKAKTVAWIKSHTIISKEKRKQSLESYRYMYEDHHFFHQNNGLENDKYYIPQVIVVKELMPKDKLDGIEKGLKKLFIKNLSHKDVIDEGFTSVDDKTKRDIKKAIDIASYDWKNRQ